jgi:D-xylose transport system permease protein
VAEIGVRTAALAVATLGSVAILNDWRGIPMGAVILFGFVLLFVWVTTRTQFGRHIYAVGGNIESARRAGVKVVRVRWIVLMLSSFMAAVAALLSVSRVEGAGTLTGGSDQLLEAIGAAVIGGASLFGGRGTVWAALLGALVMGSLSNGLDLTGQPEQVKIVTEGAILLIAIGIDTFARRRSSEAVR